MAASRRSADRALLRDRPARSKPVKRAAVLSADQMAAMIGAAGPRDAALIALMTAGAMRVGEATLLTWGDVDGCDVEIPGNITKTGAGRCLTLPDAACRLLQQWREACPITNKGWVFPGLRGQPTERSCCPDCVQQTGRHGGRGGRLQPFIQALHALTAAHQSGLSLREVATISGHASLAALERYLDQDAAREKADGARGLLLASVDV
jgi:integrase/recombinase XerD